MDFPDLSKFINDPILHDPLCPAIPVKLLSDIPKFDKKQGEYPKKHVMTFHLWCSSKSFIDDSIHFTTLLENVDWYNRKMVYQTPATHICRY